MKTNNVSAPLIPVADSIYWPQDFYSFLAVQEGRERREMKHSFLVVLLEIFVYQACFHIHVEAGDPFIRTRGVHFLLNGTPYYAHGFNAYWLMYAASDPSQRSRVSAAFRSAFSRGLTVARTWVVSDGGYRPLQYASDSYNERTFKGLDFVMAEAGRYGITLILILANNNESFGGKKQYVNWALVKGSTRYLMMTSLDTQLLKVTIRTKLRLRRFTKWNPALLAGPSAVDPSAWKAGFNNQNGYENYTGF